MKLVNIALALTLAAVQAVKLEDSGTDDHPFDVGYLDPTQVHPEAYIKAHPEAGGEGEIRR